MAKKNQKWIQKAVDRMEKKGTIGSFTEYCGGKITAQCVEKALNSPDPKIRKKAQFYVNVVKKELGGLIQYAIGGMVDNNPDKPGLTETVGALNSIYGPAGAEALFANAMGRAEDYWRMYQTAAKYGMRVYAKGGSVYLAEDGMEVPVQQQAQAQPASQSAQASSPPQVSYEQYVAFVTAYPEFLDRFLNELNQQLQNMESSGQGEQGMQEQEENKPEMEEGGETGIDGGVVDQGSNLQNNPQDNPRLNDNGRKQKVTIKDFRESWLVPNNRVNEMLKDASDYIYENFQHYFFDDGKMHTMDSFLSYLKDMVFEGSDASRSPEYIGFDKAIDYLISKGYFDDDIVNNIKDARYAMIKKNFNGDMKKYAEHAAFLEKLAFENYEKHMNKTLGKDTTELPKTKEFMKRLDRFIENLDKSKKEEGGEIDDDVPAKSSYDFMEGLRDLLYQLKDRDVEDITTEVNNYLIDNNVGIDYVTLKQNIERSKEIARTNRDSEMPLVFINTMGDMILKRYNQAAEASKKRKGGHVY